MRVAPPITHTVSPAVGSRGGQGRPEARHDDGTRGPQLRAASSVAVRVRETTMPCAPVGGSAPGTTTCAAHDHGWPCVWARKFAEVLRRHGMRRRGR